MEFFKIVDISISESEIQEKINNAHLGEINPEIIVLNEDKGLVEIGCLWGEFSLGWDAIKGGIRYAMLDCPNALAWTITTGYPPARDKAIIHLTINREQKGAEFVDEINEFIDSWEQGLLAYFKQ